jgi:phosphoglycerate dehydrogenase-like enzyme
LHACATPAEAEAVIDGAEVIYSWAIPGELLARAKRLRWLQVMGAGVDRFLRADLPRHVIITRAPGIYGPWMAEYTLGWCLWADRLKGRTLGLIGAGDIGREVARVARGFGMEVLGIRRSGRPARHVDRVYPVGKISRVIEAADFVLCVLPLTPQTRGLIGERELRAMKPTTWLVNIGRGPVISQPALIRALQEKWIAGAILDVFETEPLPAEHPLWEMPNTVVTPHISGPNNPADIAPIFNANLRRYLAGAPLRHVVDRRRGY